MKLAEHVENIHTKIYKAFNNQFSRLGVGPAKMMEMDRIPAELHNKREKIEVLIQSHLGETGKYVEAREKALDELTFTLFNRLAALKVMEAHQLIPPVITRQAEHGDRSFGHKAWLEQNPAMRNEGLEGFRTYLKDEFNRLGEDIPLYHKNYPYALLPYVIDLDEITEAFNAVEKDPQTNNNIWKSDDILGWLYESYNNHKKKKHKEEGGKTEYNKVSLQSQVYTPRWVVEFLVNNSLGKLYLEMFPDSEIRNQYKIANAPKTQVRKPIRLHLLKLIDPATGSGNFLLYAFSFFYALYMDQIEHYGADYDEDDIPRLIIENNLHGIDLDDRAIQLAQLGLWIKARQKNRSIGNLKFNVVSSDFFLPEYKEVEAIFETDTNLDAQQKEIIREIWADLQQAYKFGSLIKIEEKLSVKLHGVLEGWQRIQYRMFDEQTLADYEAFKSNFFKNLETAVTQYAQQKGSTFLTGIVHNALTFLKILTQKYDVATANPPYTDSADFGPELKKFIESNYKKPMKFHTNLYASFIKRCFELTNEDGKLALIHPLTFMFIKTFEDVRKFILENSFINTFVYHGPDTKNIFDGAFASAPAYYVLEKGKTFQEKSWFVFLDQYTRTPKEKFKKTYLIEALEDHISGDENIHNFILSQSKLKIIKAWPFVFWISDNFRGKFRENLLGQKNKAITGLMTGDNSQFLRYWWEVKKENISLYYPLDKKKWVMYQKGGPFKKWFGNNWLVVNFQDNGSLLATTDNKEFYFREGISYSALGKGSFRYIYSKFSFDKGGSCIFCLDGNIDNKYLLGFLNSKLTAYTIHCLNPTVNSQVGDFRRLPIVYPIQSIKDIVVILSNRNIQIHQNLNQFSIYNEEFKLSPIVKFKEFDFRICVKRFLNFENQLTSQVLINEAIINEKIFEVYSLTELDKAMVLAREGESIGGLPVSTEAKAAYLNEEEATKEFPLDNIRDFIKNLPEKEFIAEERESVEKEFPQLYQSNNNLEEFCIRHHINPINVWYWFKQNNVIPKQRMNDLAMEFLADMLREILMEDEDGIIPLVPNAGEKVLIDRIEEKFMEKGFSRAQYSSFDSVLGRELNEYINRHFFKAFSDHLNLFMYLPKTPFIWHITSGPEQGFDCYIIIYKWNRDKLLRIRSVYIEHRERALVNRQLDLANDDSPRAQNEKEKIRRQLEEIERFKQKIDELLTEGYNPVLDDGVGKNIAPLQKKGMLPYDVLNPGQLKKYLNADW
jgi:hypothetical protein